MIGILLVTAIAALLLAWRGVPKGLVQGVALGGAAFAVAVAIIDPSARPDLDALLNWKRAGVIILAIAVPVGIYALVIRGLRRLARPKGGGTDARAHPEGFVLIEEDAGLAADVAAREAAEARAAGHAPADRFSVAYRDGNGAVVASGGVTIERGLAAFDRVRLEPPAAGDGLDRKLVAEMEAAARARGARRALLATGEDAAPRHAADGWAEAGRIPYPEGPARVWLVKELS